MRGGAGVGEQVGPVHTLHRMQGTGAVGREFELGVDRIAIEESVFRDRHTEGPMDDAQITQEVHGGAGVIGMHHAVVFGHVVRQGREGLAGPLGDGFSVGIHPVVLRVLRRGGRGEHPLPGGGGPLGGLRIRGQQAGDRGQAAGGPAVLLHLRVHIDPALRGHVAEARGVVLMHGGDHRPGFLVDGITEHQRRHGQSGDRRAALALAEKAEASLAPLGPPVFLAAEADGGTDAVGGSGVVREAQVADGLPGHGAQLVTRATADNGIILGRTGGGGEGESAADRLDAVPVAAAEEVPAVGADGPVGEIADAGGNPFFNDLEVTPAEGGLGAQFKGGWFRERFARGHAGIGYGLLLIGYLLLPGRVQWRVRIICMPQQPIFHAPTRRSARSGDHRRHRISAARWVGTSLCPPANVDNHCARQTTRRGTCASTVGQLAPTPGPRSGVRSVRSTRYIATNSFDVNRELGGPRNIKLRPPF